jgi:predicted ATP-dependent serine protease
MLISKEDGFPAIGRPRTDRPVAGPGSTTVDPPRARGMPGMAPGGCLGWRQAANAKHDHARRTNACVVLVSHGTKADSHSGPMALEHLVEVSLRVAKDPKLGRYIVADKNRHGPAGPGEEVPLTMTKYGLIP